MLNNELSRLNKRRVGETNQNTSVEPSTYEELAEMLALSRDVAQTLSGETIHKLWECYVDMIGEVKESLKNLYENILIEIHELNCESHEGSGYSDLAASFESDSFIPRYGYPVNDWNKYFAIN